MAEKLERAAMVGLHGLGAQVVQRLHGGQQGASAALGRYKRPHIVGIREQGDPNVRRPAEKRPTDGPSLYEKMVAQQLLDERAAVLAQLASHGVLTVDTDADTLHPKLIGTYLELKERGRV